MWVARVLSQCPALLDWVTVWLGEEPFMSEPARAAVLRDKVQMSR